MVTEAPYSDEQVSSFVDILKNDLPDTRDNRGKRHSLVFVIVAFVLATILGRQKLSSIHRFIRNRLDWLRELTQIQGAQSISRAHLPRLLQGLDWPVLDKLIERCFGVRIQCHEDPQWVAVDGKTLRGTLAGGENQSLILAITHETHEVVGQARQIGAKSSEIPVIRELLKATGLEQQKVSLDAHHFNPETTAQIHQAGGIYLIQAKENQPILLQQCQTLAASHSALAETAEHDKAHGRITSRRAKLFSLAPLILDQRWKDSGLSTLVVMERETFEVSKQKTTVETSYYVSNPVISSLGIHSTAQDLTQAIRQHWGVESNNWIRDVTFKEDHIKTKAGNQAQIMGRLRSLAMALIRKSSAKNFQAAIETFIDSVPTLESMLRQVKFL
jgi:predicted transposase YbfD/YdcC